jgi:serine phosphatase RsbU (regulator of sigma subunit)
MDDTLMNNDEVMKGLSGALDSLLNGEKCCPLILPADYPDNELKILAVKVNETIEWINKYTSSLLSISNGDNTYEIPKSKMRIYGALKNLQANLNHLTYTTQRIAGGDFNQTVDFMGEFSKAFNSMTLQLREAFELIEAQKNDLLLKEMEINRDLKLAAVIQKSLVSDKVRHAGVDTHTIYTPMIQVGGDIYSFIDFRDEDKFGVFIADVNGHGVHAALVTGIIKVLINTAGDIRKTPSELLYYINNRIVDLDLDIYFTALYGICDIRNHLFTYARGGHTKPFKIRANGGISVLEADGPLLGVMKEITIEDKNTGFTAGDKIILYTDGLTETENIDGISFEEKGLNEILSGNAEMNIKDFVNTIYAELINFRGSDHFDDDVCIAGIELV